MDYIYKRDLDKFGVKVDVWEVIEPDDKGIYYGDCESYCLTVDKLVPECKGVDLYFCRIRGGGHCIMIKDDMVLDCNAEDWTPIAEYTERYEMTGLKKYWKIAIWYKKIVRKLVKMFTGK
jgi:hypothetical protein